MNILKSLKNVWKKAHGHLLFGRNVKSQYEYYACYTKTGKKIRPSNWPYRVAGLTSTFDSRKRLRYCNALMPTVYENHRYLRVDKKALKKEFPELYDTIIQTIVMTGAMVLKKK